MSLKNHNRLGSEEEPSIDLSPMIDCIFILLIFFIVTTVFVEESGLQVNKPDSASAASNDDNESIVFDINEDNEVIFDAKAIGINEVTAHVKSGVSEPSTPVVIRASQKSDHGTFVAVWDAARRGGAEVLSFNTVN